jgi:hypothetical protein
MSRGEPDGKLRLKLLFVGDTKDRLYWGTLTVPSMTCGPHKDAGPHTSYMEMEEKLRRERGRKETPRFITREIAAKNYCHSSLITVPGRLQTDPPLSVGVGGNDLKAGGPAPCRRFLTSPHGLDRYRYIHNHNHIHIFIFMEISA